MVGYAQIWDKRLELMKNVFASNIWNKESKNHAKVWWIKLSIRSFYEVYYAVKIDNKNRME